MTSKGRLARVSILLASVALLAAFGLRWVHPASAFKDGSGGVGLGAGGGGEPVLLPDGWILYSDVPQGDQARAHQSRALFRRRADGSGVTQLTFGGHADGSPRVMADGRVLFERRFLSLAPPRSPAWMTIHPDGTQIALYRDGARPAPDAGAADPRPPILTSVVRADRHTGTLLCLNAYASRLAGIAGLPRGTIRKVVVSRADMEMREPLAEEAVEPDGSFFVEVPADTPLRLTLLGPSGRVLASLDSGIWVRPNENRGCIGCHERPDLAPQNRQPLALARRGGHAH